MEMRFPGHRAGTIADSCRDIVLRPPEAPQALLANGTASRTRSPPGQAALFGFSTPAARLAVEGPIPLAAFQNTGFAGRNDARVLAWLPALGGKKPVPPAEPPYARPMRVTAIHANTTKTSGISVASFWRAAFLARYRAA